MKFLKISQSVDLLDEKAQARIAKIYNQFLDELGGNRYKSGRYFEDYTEFTFEDNGTYYIQVVFKKDTMSIRLEKYYENEFMQDEWGKAISVPFYPDDLAKSVDVTRRGIEKLRRRI